MTIFADLKGLTLARIGRIGNEELLFVTTDDRHFNMWHSQDCCESVEIEEIVGDLDDLIGSPILEAEESSNGDNPANSESSTWTFYKIGTIKGHVNIRWLGVSNGYYSESVSFAEVNR